MRIFGRWLLYTFGGAVILLLLLAGGGDVHGVDEPKHWRSIILSFVGLVFGLVGLAAVFIARTPGGAAAGYWPAISTLSWTACAAFVVGAWFSIADDLRRGAKKSQR